MTTITLTFESGETYTIVQPVDDPPGSPFHNVIGAICDLTPDEDDPAAKLDELVDIFGQLKARGIGLDRKPSAKVQTVLDLVDAMPEEDADRFIAEFAAEHPVVLDKVLARMRAQLAAP